MSTPPAPATGRWSMILVVVAFVVVMGLLIIWPDPGTSTAPATTSDTTTTQPAEPTSP